jgi:hypothetical protein
MHAFGLNITDLMVKLLHGTMACDEQDDKSFWKEWRVLVGETWTKHGALVEHAKQYLPGFFDRAPHNPTKRLNSGYKCVEFLHWMFGLNPAFLYGVLPDEYWRHFCKLVAGTRTIFKRRNTRTNINSAHDQLTTFKYDLEELYAERKVSRMHFMPQSTHTITHAPEDTTRIGPLVNSSQFVMERTIGDLGAEMKQPSNPYANFTQRALRRAQTNCLKALYSSFDHGPGSDQPSERKTPHINLDGGFSLLHPRQERAYSVRDIEALAIERFYEEIGGPTLREQWINEGRAVTRWGRIQIPGSGLVIRSAWKELSSARKTIRISRNIRVCTCPFPVYLSHFTNSYLVSKL